jgi:hypothetical protein
LKKQGKNVLLVALITAFSAIAIFILVAIIKPSLLDTGFTKAFGIVSIMVVAFVILYFEKYAAKRVGLICPNCKEMISGDEIKIVTSTRHCTYCGKEVFSE